MARKTREEHETAEDANADAQREAQNRLQDEAREAYEKKKELEGEIAKADAVIQRSNGEAEVRRTAPPPAKKGDNDTVYGSVTWLGDPGDEDNRVNTWNGHTFEKGEAVELTDAKMVEKARSMTGHYDVKLTKDGEKYMEQRENARAVSDAIAMPRT